MNPRIEADNIAFSYGRQSTAPVFAGVSFSVRKADVFCLLGPNGTGKSTLLKCLGGILRVQQGKVLLEGRSILDLPLPETARMIGYVPQGLTSAFPFRLKDIVVMGRAPHLGILASPSNDDMELAHHAMEAVGILPLAERPCNSVSGGEWQLTLIARALVQAPQILLLDEPTSHLDMGNQIRILRVIRDLALRGMTIIMASHFPDHAFIVADMVAILNQGRISCMGTPEMVITEENMKATYGVDVRIVEAGGGLRRKVCVPSLG